MLVCPTKLRSEETLATCHGYVEIPAVRCRSRSEEQRTRPTHVAVYEEKIKRCLRYYCEGVPIRPRQMLW